MTEPKPQKKPHHHGDLRRALIEASIALMAEDGGNALSIRKAAARAGVSHAAPAHHFPTLAHLRSAVIAEGHRRFTTSMQEARAAAPNSPRAQVLAASRGYLAFARAHPGLFEVMFSAEDCAVDSAERDEATAGSYAVLAEIARPFAGGDPAAQALMELRIWSTTHGFASLAISGSVHFTDDEALAALMDSLLPQDRAPTP